MTIGDATHETLWEGTSQTLAGAATGGKLPTTKYRLTPWHLYIEKGVVRTDSQQIPTAAVHDVDVKQTMTQKARGVGDVHVHVSKAGVMETVILESVKDPKPLRDMINTTAGRARAYYAEQQRQQVTVSAASPAQAPAAPPQGDVIEQLTKLAALRDQGILSDDEFAAQKAKILAG